MEGFDQTRDFWFWAALILPLIFAITVHEVAHGWVAKQLGDPTASDAGRLTLNPIRHVDPIGTILFPLLSILIAGFPFGWAKPVPVDFSRLGSPRRDLILVAAAGPGSNLLMALIWTIVLVAGRLFLPIWGEINLWIDQMAQLGITVNVFIAVFNMLPIPPLDGGRVLAGLLPRPMARVLDKIEPFGILIVFGAILLDLYTDVDIIVPFVLVPVAEVRGIFESIAEYLFTLAGA